MLATDAKGYLPLLDKTRGAVPKCPDLTTWDDNGLVHNAQIGQIGKLASTCIFALTLDAFVL